MTEQHLLNLLKRIEAKASIGQKNVLSTTEAAYYLDISPNTMYRLTSKRAIPYFKATGGKLNYFLKADLDAWAMKTEVKTSEEAERVAAKYCLTNNSIS
jgi:excisionase family DNA binding protein